MWAAKKRLGLEVRWLVFILPALVFYLGFLLLPTLSSTYYSLTDWDGVNSKFIGLSNYIEMFQDQMILTAFKNTAQFTITITILQNLLGLGFALLLVKKFAGVNLMRTMFFMPSIFSTLLIGYVWGFILEPNIGVLNNLLNDLQLGYLTVGWLSNPFWAKWMISFITSWQFLGYAMVIYIAGLQANPKELYECGEIEGANDLKKFIHVSIIFIYLASLAPFSVFLLSGSPWSSGIIAASLGMGRASRMSSRAAGITGEMKIPSAKQHDGFLSIPGS